MVPSFLSNFRSLSNGPSDPVVISEVFTGEATRYFGSRSSAQPDLSGEREDDGFVEAAPPAGAYRVTRRRRKCLRTGPIVRSAGSVTVTVTNWSGVVPLGAVSAAVAPAAVATQPAAAV